MDWRDRLRYDPLKPLLESDDPAIVYFARRDLLDEQAGPVSILWSLKEPRSILQKQQPDGYWRYPGKGEDHYLLATFKALQRLVYCYEADRSLPATTRACDYLFSHQTEEGDIRGFIGNQYAPYYTGLVTALLIKAGYEDDARVEKALVWLLEMRQDDGGWVIGSPGILGIPHLTREELYYLVSDTQAETARAFDRAQPFSHSGTGMVIRAFAMHRRFHHSQETLKAAELLKSHFFQNDNYSSYFHADHWVRFDYPFWWNSLLAALDSLSLIGFMPSDSAVKTALDWFIVHQQEDGLWKVSYSAIHKAPTNSQTAGLRLWVTLAICRVFRRFYH